ncbi:SIR2 family protein [Ruminococcus bicirculans]|uniref:NAD(+) hydrolase ThsA n=1 Tax=Ruminococcus bicirculans (ex Wegman et al. 2014) TaxID=1160721 RepID=A0AAW6E340_9FIRM|nr:SIR2 family protein [Ruminococcus bicirculans (ex Wegman et al. 2014)]MDB8744354.1 SIR2 family protein [Ruminococcus bicirculans (ex Wegman et al. 2014)]MDB8747219.1 SIR2 family protein [Ruminococcus bicirculans (ex Wegman et al. 2014)]MDB8752468.1 SIR2 family protein [Ruminococcus bicirculans (ex Wegman et al. 2014)]
MNKDISLFIDRYVKEIQNYTAAMFIGAGFSMNAGYVDWKSLLSGIAEDLGLDIEKETDLVSLAQYNYNENGQNRGVINHALFEEFTKEKDLDENHRILARLPISTFWTTNYDSLIEEALRDARKTVDVKHCNSQLSLTVPHRDAIVYKMHGDKSNPNEAILIKDDYEQYYQKHAQFITSLSGDLISKTFLFIGFSFSDPNLDYILSRIRIDYKENNRQHYAIMRNVSKNDYESEADYDYAKRKQELFMGDLKRYSIKPLMIDDYSEITDILKEINRRLNHNNVFVSGSAYEYSEYSEDEKAATDFIQSLSQRLIQKGFNIISGFGLGVGSAVIYGALQEIYMKNQRINDERLLLRPFPQGEDYKAMWKEYREDMISRAGVSIFIFGNKYDAENESTVLAGGMKQEFEMATEQHNLIVPVGCTGYMAHKIWEEIHEDLSKYYTNVDDELTVAFKKLNNKCETSQLIDNILSFIDLFKNGKHTSAN